MPRSRIEIPWPVGGLNEDAPTGKQPPLTAREFHNVRTIDARTGRSRGGQRPGHSRFLSNQLSGSNKVQNLNMALDDVPRVTYDELQDTRASGDVISVEWSKSTTAVNVRYGVDVDRQGNVYTLDGDNAVRKYNSDGELIYTIIVRTEGSDQLHRRIVVDEFDNIYIGVFREVTATGPTGKIIKYRPVSEEDGTYATHWTLELSGSIADFMVRFGSLGVLEHRSMSGETSGTLAFLVAYDGIFTSQPELVWQRQAPYPGNAIDIGSQGAFYTTHEAGTSRGLGQGSGDFTARAVSWVPHELTNADQRLYFWLDAETLDGTDPGPPAPEVFDAQDIRRFQGDYRENGGSDLSADIPLDDTTRNAFAQEDADPEERLPPTWRQFGAGTAPTFHFDGDEPSPAGSSGPPGRAFRTPLTPVGASSETKDDADGKYPNARGVFVPHTEYNYFVCAVFRPAFGMQQSAPMLATSRGNLDDTSEKLVHFCYGSRDNTSYSNATLDFGEGAIQVRNTAADNINQGVNHPLYGTIGTSPNIALITYVDNQRDASTRSPADDCAFRLNGSAIDRWGQTTLGSTFDGWDGHECTFGHGTIRANDSGSQFTLRVDDDTNPNGWIGFEGELLEVITVLADSSADTSPHDQDVDQPLRSDDRPPVTGENSGSVEPGPSAAATDIEFVEGYLAHKWGFSHLLPNGDGGGADGEGLFPDHPFGGTANTPSGNGSSLTTSDDTAALFSEDPITAKWGANAGELQWALDGGGMGSGLAVDSENDVLTIGTKVSGTGPSGNDESNVIGRKIIDQGTDYSADEGTRSEGTYTFSGTTSDGDTITVGDRTYTFRASITETTADEILVGGSAAATIANVEAAINLSSTTTGYSDATPRNEEVYVSSTTATTVVVAAKVAGTDGDSITFTESSGDISADGGGTLGGTTSGVDGDGAWTFDDTGDQSEPDYHKALLEIDDNDDLYIPVSDTTNDFQIVKRAGAHGFVEWIYDVSDSAIDAYGVSFPGDHPVYDSDDITGPQFLYVTTNNDDAQANPTLRKLKLVAIANEGDPTNANLRQPVYVGVSNGNIVTFQRAGSVTTPSGGSSALDADSPYIFSTRAFRKIYYTDGVSYKFYDPDGYDATTPANGTDEVSDWTSDDSGEIPKYAKLIAFWNGRMVLARTADEPQNWFMSRKGNPNNWDFFPAVPTVLDAIAGNDSRAGVCPDVIQSLIPYSDDLLIVGGDNTIHMMTGDPADQGYFDLVSDSTGTAFGNPWCKDPEGLLYFFGSRGGVYVMSPGKIPAKLTRDTIQRRLEDVDLLTYRPVMAWDTRNEGMFLYFVPYGAGGTLIDGFFWDKKHNSWSVVNFTSTDYQPTALSVFDGDDPDDRVVVMGCEDGRVRFVDEDSKGDDSSSGDNAGKIDSYVLFGPIAAGAAQERVRFTQLEALLANDQDGCNVEWFVSDHPDEIGTAINVRRLTAGRNPWDNKKARGSYVWVRLRNASSAQTWALERLSVAVFPAGRSRVSYR